LTIEVKGEDVRSENMEYKVKDIGLAEQGRKKIEWAESRMPVMIFMRKKYSKQKPLKGAKIAGSLHVTKETAVLVETLRELGAEVAWCGCNPLSTQDDIAAALAAKGTSVFAWRGLSTEEYYWCIEQTLKLMPSITLDDGADLVFTIHNKHPELAKGVIGGTEETTTGVHRLRAMAADGKLLYPIIAVNDAETKWDFDNVYGTGQSSIDGIIRATNILIAGKNFVVAGYGHCGKGVAMRARGLGANVIVTEVDPIAALKARLEGYRVMPMDEAAKIGDIFITATGIKDVIIKRHFQSMKDGAVVCNTGHYNVELNIPDLGKLSRSKREIRPNNEEYRLKNGRRIYLLAEGRLVNLAAAEGHPSEVMDMSFANQVLAMMYIYSNKGKFSNKVYEIPEGQDHTVASLKLETMGLKIDKLTKEQERYATAYEEGT
jgi:adenosylhomocysteinase